MAPPYRGSIIDFIESRRILPPGSAVPGPKKISKTPALRELYNWFQCPSIREMVIRKPAQFGVTDFIVDLIVWIAENDPAPVGLFFSDERTCRKIMKTRIKPALESLGIITVKAANKAQELTSYECSLPNGFSLVVSWGSSVAATASLPFKYLFVDELDKPGYSLSKDEGGVMGRLRDRTETYPDHKIIWFSTPTVPTGRISEAFDGCEEIYDYCVTCPECGVEQPLEWGYDPQQKDQESDRKSGVTWSFGRKATKAEIRSTARYKCCGCGCLWDTKIKNRLVVFGRYLPRGSASPDGKPERIGVQLNRLASLFPGGRIDKLVTSFLDSLKSGPDELQNFINSTLGLPFEIKHIVKNEVSDVEAAQVDGLNFWDPPEASVALIISVDVQKEGFWYLIRAWDRDMTSWLIGCGFAPTEQELDELIFEKLYEKSSGQAVPVWRAGIDTGGGLHSSGESSTEYVYDWFIRHRLQGVNLYLLKGSNRVLPGKLKIGSPLEKLPSGFKVPPGVLLQIVELDTVKLKDEFFWRLEKARNGETGGAYLPRNLSADYIRHITSEEKVVDKETKRVEYRLKGKRANHLLDCEMMQLALAGPEMVGGVRLLMTTPGMPRKKREQAPNQVRKIQLQGSPWVKKKTGGWL